MDSKVPYHPLKNQEDHPLIERPRPKMTRLLRPPPNQNRKQAIKKGFPVFHKISFKSANHHRPIPPSEIRSLITHLKRSRRAKPLPRLEISIALLRLSENSFVRLLKHAKYFSKIHFYTDFIFHYSLEELNLNVSRVLRSIHALPRLKIQLSLFFHSYALNQHDKNLPKMVTSFNKHRCFTSAHFSFRLGCEVLKRQKLISILKHSRSLSQLSLNFGRDNGSVTGWQKARRHFFSGDLDPQLHDVFGALKNIKTLKNCRLCFRHCLLSNVELNDLKPALKEAAQSFNLEFIIDGYSYITKFGWWQFSRSIRNLSHSRTISVKHTLKVDPFSRFHAFLGTFIFVIALCIIWSLGSFSIVLK